MSPRVHALADAGARSRMLLYLTEPHGSFVLKWRPPGSGRVRRSR